MMPRSHSFAISLNRSPKWRDKVRDRMAPSLSRHCSRQNGGRGLAETGLFSAFAVITEKIAGFAIRQYPVKFVPPFSLLLRQYPPVSAEMGAIKISSAKSGQIRPNPATSGQR